MSRLDDIYKPLGHYKSEAKPDWDAFSDKLDEAGLGDGIDQLYQNKLADFNAPIASDWDKFEELLPEAGMEDHQFDEAFKNRLQDHHAKGVSPNWELLEEKLNEEDYSGRVFMLKLVEAAAVFLIFFYGAYQYKQYLKYDAVRQQVASYEARVDHREAILAEAQMLSVEELETLSLPASLRHNLSFLSYEKYHLPLNYVGDKQAASASLTKNEEENVVVPALETEVKTVTQPQVVLRAPEEEYGIIDRIPSLAEEALDPMHDVAFLAPKRNDKLQAAYFIGTGIGTNFSKSVGLDHTSLGFQPQVNTGLDLGWKRVGVEMGVGYAHVNIKSKNGMQTMENIALPVSLYYKPVKTPSVNLKIRAGLKPEMSLLAHYPEESLFLANGSNDAIKPPRYNSGILKKGVSQDYNAHLALTGGVGLELNFGKDYALLTDFNYHHWIKGSGHGFRNSKWNTAEVQIGLKKNLNW